MATGTGVQRESRPPRGGGRGTVICTPATLPCPASSLSADPHCSGLMSWLMQKGSHPARSQRPTALPPSAPVSAPGPGPGGGPSRRPAAPGAPGGRWLKRAWAILENRLRAANDRRPPGPALPARGGGGGGLDWQRRPGWNSGGVRGEEGPSGPPPGQAPPKAPPPPHSLSSPPARWRDVLL